MLQIYNNKTKSKEIFIPINKNEITMYVCGPTLYDEIHIGNARPIIFFDTIYRFFKKQNLNIKYVSNITDIDDKIIKKAQELKISEKELVDSNLIKFNKTLKDLNVLDVDIRPNVTEYMEQIIIAIDDLIKKDYAYVTKNKDVYFRINKIDDYGKIANETVENLLTGVRIDVNTNKESPLDFALWKGQNTGTFWEAPFGKGRPGWHTECMVMIKDIFGSKIDIHGGGIDLKFPHHENENAQFCALNHSDITNHWIHNGFVNINDEKMSKSLNNFVTVNELKEQYNTNIIRLLLLQTNYRQPINLNEEFIRQTQKLETKILNFTNTILDKEYNQIKEAQLSQIILDTFNDDFNTPNLISLLLTTIKENNKKDFILICEILGLKYHYTLEDDQLNSNILNLKEQFTQALADKHFEVVDKIKIQLKELNYEITNTRNGIIIKNI